jgi:hypothetical protein
MSEIDKVLRNAVEAGELPNVVAITTDIDGTGYEGGMLRRSCVSDVDADVCAMRPVVAE